MTVTRCVGVGLFIMFAGLRAAAGEPEQASPYVLDTYSYWRSFLTCRPIVVAETTDGAVIPDGEPRTVPPPADWTSPDFDDGRWCRTMGPLFTGQDGKGYGLLKSGGGMSGSETTSLICLRGKFSVSDPSKVKSLALSAAHRGGMVVWVNGTEVARGHVAAGAWTPETMGEAYPLEAYAGPDGRSGLDPFGKNLDGEVRKRLEQRLRRMEKAAIPAQALRKGVNVLAIAIHRSPVHPESRTSKDLSKFTWTTAGIEDVRLEAFPPDSVACNTRRPKGVQVWNEDAIADVYDLDYGDPNEPLRPIDLVGVRHGAFSGQVAVGSDAPIRGLSARVSDLASKEGGHVIPAGAIRLLYPLPDGIGGQEGRTYRGGFRPGSRFDALAELPPAEVPLAEIKPRRGYSGPLPVPGAVQPVRVTVDVPADAAAGDYQGTLSLKAEGLAEVTVPVKLTVLPWTLPDSCDFTSVLGVVESAESLAVRYDVPVWSERHWELIDRSFRILGRAGTDAVFLPLVMKNHHGREAMVRWVRNDDGTYSHDFSLFEKYLDTALKHIKRPEVVALYVWDRAYRVNPGRSVRLSGKAADYVPPPVVVPLLDRKTGEVSEMKGPPYNDPGSVAFWKPVLDGCHERLKQRGIADRNILLGVVPDGGPAAETVDMFHEAAPWAEWLTVSHAPGSRFKGNKVPEVKVAFAAGVYGGTRRVPNPAEHRYYAWKPYNKYTERFGVFPRIGAPYTYLEKTSCPACWTFQEAYLMTGVRGPMRIGGEFWQLTDKGEGASKKSWTFISKYSGSVPGVSQSVMYVLAPGPEGALSTLRLETLYEGSQEGEARVFIEKALESGKGKLAFDGMSADDTHKQLQEMLDRRQRTYAAYWPVIEWYGSSGWQARSKELYRAAAQVEAATAGK